MATTKQSASEIKVVTKPKEGNFYKDAQTHHPTGLSIARSGAKFTCKWKIGDKDYGDGQSFQWRVKYGGKWKDWTSVSCGKTTTSKTVELNLNNYSPASGKSTLNAFQFRVRGNRKDTVTESGKSTTFYTYTASIWAESSVFAIDAQSSAPSLSASLSDTYSNVCKFSWDVSTSSTGHQMFRDVEYQSFLASNSDTTDGTKFAWNSSKPSWKTGTGSASSSITITEDSGNVSVGSHTRWVRVRARGSGGNSGWRYAKHVYAIPKQSKITKVEAKTTNAESFRCTVTWQSDAPPSHPIDKTVVQYCITEPEANLACPNGASWTDAVTIKDTGGADKASFSIDDVLSLDQCLYVRVNNHHDTDVTYGKPYLASVGYLKDPTSINVEVIDSTHVMVEAENASNVPDAFLAIYYREGKNAKNDTIVGIIPHEDTDPIGIVIPATTGAKAFGAKAIVGSYSKQVRADGTDVYKVTAKMTSEHIYWDGGAVPSAPANVALSRGRNDGTVHVTWDWSWDGASGAEISWADHDDAWESTDEPDTYTVSNMHTGQWNISGLATGVTWYVRIRLISGTGDDITYGPWSDMASISLSSAPSIPSLNLSAAIVPHDGEVMASWVYVSTDGSPQGYAEICDIEDITNLSAEYVLSHDTEVKAKSYFVRSGSGTELSPYVYKQIDTNEYELTTDTSVQGGTVYYSRTGSGSAASPYVYTIVQNPTGNPQSKGYYVLVGVSEDDPSAEGWYVVNRRIIASATTEYHATISAEAADWREGETHSLAVRVVSQSGIASDDWSDFVSIAIVEPLTCTITQHSLEVVEVPEDDDEQTTREITSLTEMPMTVTVVGAGEGGITTVAIERAESYPMTRPDESIFNGYKGETVALVRQSGEAQIEIATGDLIGMLDDGAPYVLIATVQDTYGQSAEARIEFEVHWSHQAVMPLADRQYDTENFTAIITPIMPPVGALATDRCDIYRLSADKPELIYPDAEFGESYVDPYPALGEFSGHRIVFKTENGDYITEDNRPAWIDITGFSGSEYLDYDGTVIDTDSGRIFLRYAIEVSNQWQKDFKETKYLGGSVQGDWNKAISRTATISAKAIGITDQETIDAMRRLSAHPGICHIRTFDGSSFAADIQVSEDRSVSTRGIIVDYSLSITRVDSEGYDGQKFSEYAGNSVYVIDADNEAYSYQDDVDLTYTDDGEGNVTISLDNELDAWRYKATDTDGNVEIEEI